MINKRIVDKNREAWREFIAPVASKLKLADGKTIAPVSEKITMQLTMLDANLKEHTCTFTALVMEMDGLDFIIGLYDIIDKYGELYLEIISRAVAKRASEKAEEADQVATLSDYGDIKTNLQPGDMLRWSGGDDDGSPESEECPTPCSFTAALHFMETGYDEALEKYKSQIEEHVEKTFLNHKGVRELLLSDLAIDRFVPKEWTGLQGFETLELDFKDTLPAEHPVRSRPINPRLFEHS